MLERYKLFLNDVDKILNDIFEHQKRYVKCKKGCSLCCEVGDYPFSQLEFSYLTQGFINLSAEKKLVVQQNIKQLLKDKENFKGNRFEHKCPFLINNECCVYEYRGLVCRTFGVCYYDDTKNYVKLPACVHYGLNYSEFYDEEKHFLNVREVPTINLRIDKLFDSQLALQYKLDSGEIRPMLEWFGTIK